MWMKFILPAALTFFAVSQANALELTQSLALNTDVTFEHKIDADTTQVDFAPELSWTPMSGLELLAGTSLDVYDRADGFTLADEFDTLPTVTLGAEYQVPAVDNMELAIGTAYNFDTKERDDVTITATFNF